MLGRMFSILCRHNLLSTCQMIFVADDLSLSQVYLPRAEVLQRRLKANLPKAVHDGDSQ
jgi:hypothetical protein